MFGRKASGKSKGSKGSKKGSKNVPKKVPKARKSRRAAKASRPTRAPARPTRVAKSEEELAASRRTRAFVVGTVAFAAVGLGSTVGLDWLDARAEQMLDARPVPVAFEWAPWLPESSREQLSQTLLTALGARPVDPADVPHEAVVKPEPGGFDDERFASVGPTGWVVLPGSLSTAPLRRASLALSETGWFIDEPVVRRGRGGAIAVEGDWRSPTAWVRHGGSDRLVDIEGRPLPYAEATSGSVERELAVILGVPRGPLLSGATSQPLWGEAWQGAHVSSALALLRVLGENNLLEQVRAIDVSRLDRATEVSIITDRGSTIVWGAPPGEWRPEDVRTTEEKVARLQDYAARTGRIDANERALEIYGPYSVANDQP